MVLAWPSMKQEFCLKLWLEQTLVLVSSRGWRVCLKKSFSYGYQWRISLWMIHLQVLFSLTSVLHINSSLCLSLKIPQFVDPKVLFLSLCLAVSIYWWLVLTRQFLWSLNLLNYGVWMGIIVEKHMHAIFFSAMITFQAVKWWLDVFQFSLILSSRFRSFDFKNWMWGAGLSLNIAGRKSIGFQDQRWKIACLSEKRRFLLFSFQFCFVLPFSFLL